MTEISFAIITVSDTCFAKTNEDRSGPALERAILKSFPNAKITDKTIVPDVLSSIQETLNTLSNTKCNVILTTGGTGFSPNDVTPEATKGVIDKEAPGLAYAMITKSLQITEMAILSRATCGIKDSSLIINLPGSVKGSTECFGFVKDAIPHAVALITGNQELVRKTHAEVQGISLESKVRTNNVANRDRKSPYPMLEVPKAQELVFENCESFNATEIINIENSLGRILAEAIVSEEPFPPFPASIKDGYAVMTCDGAGIRTVRDAVAAGDEINQEPLKAGEIIRISTGAAIPLGADAVVQVEDTALVEASEDGSKELKVEIKVAPKLGQDIRPVGSDLPTSTTVLEKRDRITPATVGILATIGKTKVEVFVKPTVGIISTGNELQKHDEIPKPGHIRDSNKLTLLNLLKQHGYLADDCGITKDEPNCVRAAFTAAFSKYDVVVTTGGVSMGEFDLVKEVLRQDFNATIHFGRINMKPGKPTTFATCTYNDKFKIVFGLPGNPVSATVTSVLFVIPLLRHLENSKITTFSTIPVSMGEDVVLDDRPEYRRVKLERHKSKIIAYGVGNQISSRLNSFVGATGLVYLPSKSKKVLKIKTGSIVDAYLIDICL